MFKNMKKMTTKEVNLPLIKRARFMPNRRLSSWQLKMIMKIPCLNKNNQLNLNLNKILKK